MAPAAALAVLSLPWYATDHDRKTAYRQLALRHHPDQNRGDPTATGSGTTG